MSDFIISMDSFRMNIMGFWSTHTFANPRPRMKYVTAIHLNDGDLDLIHMEDEETS